MAGAKKKSAPGGHKPSSSSTPTKATRGTEFRSRCAPSYFKDVMDRIVVLLSDQHKHALQQSPFYFFVDMPELSISHSRIEALITTYNAESNAFVVGNGLSLNFDPAEFCVTLGLRQCGLSVDLDLNLECKTLFDNWGRVDYNLLKRSDVVGMLQKFAVDESRIDDFIRMFSLLVFSCILFPCSSYSIPRFVYPYIVDVSRICEYAWGDATHKFLVGELVAHSQSKVRSYFDGCAVGLMAWFYERVPSLGKRSTLEAIPRLFRWTGSNLPSTMEGCLKCFQKIMRHKVYSVSPVFAERAFLETQGTFETRLLAMVCQENDELRKKIEMLESEWKKKKKEETETEKEKEKDEEEKENEGADGGFGPSETEEEKKEKEEEGEKENEEKEQEWEEKEDEGEEKEEEKEKKETEEEEKEEEEKEEERLAVVIYENKAEDEQNEFNEFVELNRVVNLVVDSAGLTGGLNEPNCEHGAQSSHRPPKEQASSMVKRVQERRGRKKKEKAADFMTPPSSAPKRRRKKKELQSTVNDDVESVESTCDESSLIKFRGREDFCGHEAIPEEDRATIRSFLTSDRLSKIVWSSQRVLVRGNLLIDLLFGNELNSELIHCFMEILRRRHPHVRFLPTYIQSDVLRAAKEMKKNKVAWYREDYDHCISKMARSTVVMLDEVIKSLLGVKYVFFPVHAGFHFFLVVFNVEEQKFVYHNSMDNSKYRGDGKLLAKFLAGYLSVKAGFGIHETNSFRLGYLRQQTGAKDCGVHVCMEMECYGVDTPEYWMSLNTCSVDGYRARMAALILRNPPS